MATARSGFVLVVLGWVALSPGPAHAGAEVKLSKDFLENLLEKLPALPLQ